MAGDTITPPPREALNLQAIVAGIDRDLIESRRAREEAFERMAASRSSEDRALSRGLWPWVLASAILSSVIVAGALCLFGR